MHNMYNRCKTGYLFMRTINKSERIYIIPCLGTYENLKRNAATFFLKIWSKIPHIVILTLTVVCVILQGAGFFLEDGKSAISVNDAIMWAKVNPFSPLGSGVRINPF